MRLLPEMVRVLAAIAVLGLVSAGCGDDDGGGDNAGAGGSGGGGSGGQRDGGPGAGSGGGISDEEGSEGWPCTSQNECIDDLTCVGSPITLNGVSIGVCGMSCDGDEACNGGQCITYTGAGSDAHCVNIVTEEFALCGVADTSLCSEDMTCLYLPGLPVGVCVKLCDAGGAASGDEDAGVALGGCSADQACLPDITTTGEGVCGTVVARGETCGVDLGKFCGEGDICAPMDPNDEESEYRCYQDCSENNSCDEGTCVLSQGMYAYCL